MPQPGPTSLSLEQIQNDPWGDAPAGATRLVATMHALRRVPLDALTVEDLRLLIGQHTSLTVLVPRALDSLESDPLIEGDVYPATCCRPRFRYRRTTGRATFGNPPGCEQSPSKR